MRVIRITREVVVGTTADTLKAIIEDALDKVEAVVIGGPDDLIVRSPVAEHREEIKRQVVEQEWGGSTGGAIEPPARD